MTDEQRADLERLASDFAQKSGVVSACRGRMNLVGGDPVANAVAYHLAEVERDQARKALEECKRRIVHGESKTGPEAAPRGRSVGVTMNHADRPIPDMIDGWHRTTLLVISTEGREAVRAELPADHIGHRIADQLCFYGIRISENGMPAGPKGLGWLVSRLGEHVLQALLWRGSAGPLFTAMSAMAAITPHLQTLVPAARFVPVYVNPPPSP